MGKYTVEGNQWLDTLYGNSAPGNRVFFVGMVDLDDTVQTPMKLNPLATQNRHLFRKTYKEGPQNRFERA